MSSFSNEFKNDAVKMVSAMGATSTSRILNVPKRTLNSWVKKTEEFGEFAHVGSGRKRQKDSEETKKVAEFFEQFNELIEMNKELIELYNNSNERYNNVSKRNDNLEGIIKIIKEALDIASNTEIVSDSKTEIKPALKPEIVPDSMPEEASAS